ECLFAGINRSTALDGPDGLFAQVENAYKAQGAVGAPDPDVTGVRIEIQVRAPRNDPGPDKKRDGIYRIVYEVDWAFTTAVDGNGPFAPQPPLNVVFDYQFQADIDVFAEAIAGALPQPGDPLPIPSSRDARIRLTPLCANKPNYFAGD